MKYESQIELDDFLNSPMPGATRVISEVFGTEEFSAVPKAAMDEAINRGHAVHEAIENFIKYGVRKIELKYEPYFDAFIEWYDKYKPEFLGSELRLISEELGYKGVIDAIFKVNDSLVICDFKTSSKLTLLKPTIQLNMYMLLALFKKMFTHDEVNSLELRILKLTKTGYKYILVKNDVELVNALMKLRNAKKELT